MNIYMASFQQVGILSRKARKRAFLTFISYNIRHGLVLHLIHDGRHLLYQRNEYHIPLAKSELNNDSGLKKSVKKVMETIVGLLKDRVTVEKAPDAKKRRVEEKYIH